MDINRDTDFSSIGKRVILEESNAIRSLVNKIDANFSNVINAILNSKGKVIILGIGKSGHIGRKISATLSSTGTPSIFLHPGEAFHGDLGMIEKYDIIILISYSGETLEIIQILDFIKSQGNTIVSITGNPKSTIAKNSNYNLDVNIGSEACPLNLAPTSSTTATLVLGDAIAISLMNGRKFNHTDFAKFHPGGSLGKRLLSKVKDYTQYENLPYVDKNVSTQDLIYKLAEGRLGLVIIKDETNIGIITDGDLRRSLYNIDRLSDLHINSIVNYKPISVDENTPLYLAEELMLNNRITTLLVTRNDIVVGVFQMFNLINIKN